METPPGASPDAGQIASKSPYITVFENFLSEKECALLRALGQARLAPAKVVLDQSNWFDMQLTTRNNEQHYLTQKEEMEIPAIRHILKRMHRTARIPDAHSEGTQIGRYNVSTKYEGHLDTDPPNRVARPVTLIVYLSNVTEGGETLFPMDRTDCNAGWHEDPKTGERIYGAALCCKTPELDTPATVRVSPKMGRAVLFYNHFPDGSVDPRSTHIGCPVIQGVKWITQKWFRFEGYQNAQWSAGHPGFDPRFDGPPKAKGAEDLASNLFSVSQNGPRIFLNRNWLGASEPLLLAELSALAKAGEPDKWQRFDEGIHSFKLLASKARVLSRLQTPLNNSLPHEPTGFLAYRFRRQTKGEGGEPFQRLSPLTKATADALGTWGAARPATIFLPLPIGASTPPRPKFVFPRLGDCDPNDIQGCCSNPNLLAVEPSVDDALLLYSHTSDGTHDDYASIVRCPLSEGESIIMEIAFVFPGFTPVKQTQAIPTPAIESFTIEFENFATSPFQLYWKEPHGEKREVSMGELPAGPNTRSRFTTYNDHHWVVRTSSGKFVLEYTIEPDSPNHVSKALHKVPVGKREEL